MGHYFQEFSSPDFDAFAGAEPFPNGDDPQVCYMANGCAVVAAASGYTVVLADACFVIPAQYCSAKAARRFGAGLLGDLECHQSDVADRLSSYDAIAI